jgi:hypothetical protein
LHWATSARAGEGGKHDLNTYIGRAGSPFTCSRAYFFQTRGHRGKQGRDPDCGLGVVMNSGFGFGRDWDF